MRLTSFAVMLLLSYLLAACRPSDPNQEPSEPHFVIFNFSGSEIGALTIEDSAGGQGALETGIPNKLIIGAGRAHPPNGSAYHVTVQWIAGPGLVRWRQANLPVEANPGALERLEVYLRPDGFVCAALVSNAASPKSDDEELARVTAPIESGSCVKSSQLPSLAAGTPAGFDMSQVTHSWDRYERPGKASVTFKRLAHSSGPVRFRFGEAFRGGPWYLNEFYKVDQLGDRAALLVTAPLRPATPGMFVVTSNQQGWTSRFVGQVSDSGREVADGLIIHGNRIVIAKGTGEIYLLPSIPRADLIVLEGNADAKFFVVFARTPEYLLQEGGPLVSMPALLRLADGELFDIPFSKSRQIPQTFEGGESFLAWFHMRCRWQSNIDEPLACD